MASVPEDFAKRKPSALQPQYFAEQFRKLAQHWRELAEYAEDKSFGRYKKAA
jgi:hypothetical protein